jgi:hypothetical protein
MRVLGMADWGVHIIGGWFDEATHTYRDEAGVKVISSTQVFDVTGCSDFSGIDEETLELKRVYGTGLHKCVQFLVARDLDWDSVDEQLIDPLAAIEMFLKKIEFEVEASEEMRIASIYGMKFGMTLDLRGMMTYQGKRRKVVIDLKTGTKFSKTWDWQLGSYLYPQEKADLPWMGLVMQVGKQGKVTPHYLKDVEGAKREFQILLAAANLKINNGFARIGKAA